MILLRFQLIEASVVLRSGTSSFDKIENPKQFASDRGVGLLEVAIGGLIAKLELCQSSLVQHGQSR